MADESTTLEPDGDWGIFQQLVGLGEHRLRKILRSHLDVPFRGEREDDQAQALRESLDDALERLMALELAAQAGVSQTPPLPKSDSLIALLQSSAFARYVNAYLYFGVRFVSARLLGPDSYRTPASSDPAAGPMVKAARQTFEINELPLALPVPPGLSANEAVAQVIRTWPATRDRSPDELAALAFLDDSIVDSRGRYGLFEGLQTVDAAWESSYELWLQGLGVDAHPQRESLFEQITRGLHSLIRSKVRLYIWLETGRDEERWPPERGPICMKNPLTARFGMLDLYWIARLLRADVSSTGVVTNRAGQTWPAALGEAQRRAGAAAVADGSFDFAQSEGILRAVFDYTCDLVQNAVAIAGDEYDRHTSPDPRPSLPKRTVRWRRAYDEELAEIAEQRRERGFGATAMFDKTSVTDTDGDKASPIGWSRRVRTGEHLENLIGLAFSGGGIRSATFNLGVLERLQELDLLRGVDYLSTVSGGGYIGSWLLGNVRRSNYWLSQLTDWKPSIAHLRRYSNYLSPQTGLMSVDTWTMWASWVRNAFLIQVTMFAWLAVLLLAARVGKSVFEWHEFASLATFPGNLILAPFVILLTAIICINLRKQSRAASESFVLWLGLAPMWLGAFVTAALIWADAPSSAPAYSDVLEAVWIRWLAPLTLMFISLWALSACSIDRKWWSRVAWGLLAASLAMVVVYMGFSGMRWLFRQWREDGDLRSVWFAYIYGPPFVIFVMTLAVVAIIGIIGVLSGDWRREWWTRFGAWMGISGISFLALSLVSVFGPLVTLAVFDGSWGTVQWSTVVGWVGTVVGALLSGGGGTTTGGDGRSPRATALEWLSKIGAFVFIVGAVLLGATALHAILVKVFTPYAVAPQVYWLHMSPTADSPSDYIQTSEYLQALLVATLLGLVFSWRFDINVFGLNRFYRNRLVRCYLGATRWLPGLRSPHKFTGFDDRDDIALSAFSNRSPITQPYRGPFPVVNGALNLGGSSDLGVHTRHSASWVFTPLRAGADRPAVGYAPMVPAPQGPPDEVFNGGVSLGQAISVSGAAASPNMGYSTSALVAFLLTIFNVRLAWWFPNPGTSWWAHSNLRLSTWYLARELFGTADENKRFVNVSDGGHFENLGIYELVRRRCAVIIASDAECDPQLTFASLGNVIRVCETDFGARIDIDVESIRRRAESGLSGAHCAVGTVHYSNGSRGRLIYLKSSLTGDEDISIRQYRDLHPDFPHETTADQFFAEDQFESYRLLGHHIATLTFRDVDNCGSLAEMAEKLENIWVPAAIGGKRLVDQATALNAIWERFRLTAGLHPFLIDLMLDSPTPVPVSVPPEHLAVCLELFQLMENVYVSLRLEDFWSHPDNHGWVVLFTRWAKSGTFRAAWKQTSNTFGINFVYFCERHLGL